MDLQWLVCLLKMLCDILIKLILILLSKVSPEEIVSVVPESIIVNHNDNATFTCMSDAGPNNNYQWLFKAKDLVCTSSNCSDGLSSFFTTDEGK